jgi:asparagine synthase (glutamine-hydrolysing)
MSGIVGIYNLDGKPVESYSLGRMVERLAHRGPDGADVWCDDSVGLGHRLLWTTPESLLEQLPLTDCTGNLILTADARIDNRDELISALELQQFSDRATSTTNSENPLNYPAPVTPNFGGKLGDFDSSSPQDWGARGAKLAVKNRPVEKITDSDLILAAYEKWGRDCPSKLIGDFAFASEIKGLFCLDAVPRKVNDAKVGIYLCQLSGYAKLEPDTFYQDILRLLPAHWMEVNDRGIESESFWDLDAEAKKIQQSLKTDAEYVEEFRKRFTEAIACRLRSAYPVASTLSGGVDSSSVSCVARNLLREQDSNAELLTIYSDCDTPSADETEFVDTILAQGGFKHCVAKVGNPIAAAQTVTPWLDQLVQMPTPAMLLAIVREVKQQGARVMLTGHDGDTIVSHGTDYPHELVARGEWAKLKKIVEGRYRDKSKSTKEIKADLFRYLVPYVTELIKKNQWQKYISLFYKSANYWQFSLKKNIKLFQRGIQKNFRLIKWNKHNSNINNYLANSINLPRLLQDEHNYQFGYLPSEYLNHYRGITSGNMQEASEQIDAISSGVSIEARHPFLDKRVIELYLAAPAHLKFCNGFGRGVMRRAMKDILSEEVRRRRSKVDFYGFIIQRMENIEIELIEDLLHQNKDKLSNYLDSNGLLNRFQSMANSAVEWRQKRRDQ